MNNLQRLGIGFTHKRTPRPPKQHDRFTKAQLWARLTRLEGLLYDVHEEAQQAGKEAHHAREYTHRERYYKIRDMALAMRETELVREIKRDGSADEDAA